jgi:hypothetical protein
MKIKNEAKRLKREEGLANGTIKEPEPDVSKMTLEE